MEEYKQEIIQKEEKLNEIYEKKINGILLRTKAIRIEGNEKNSKYFSNLERKNAEKKNINKLIINDREITNSTEILNEEKKLFSTFVPKKRTATSINKLFWK